jgi:hypothetical protein
MFYDQLVTAIERAARSQLDDLSRQVWLAYGAGTIDDRAHELQEMIERRRGPSKRVQALLVPSTINVSRIHRSPEQRSPNRQASLLRRREHVATHSLPPHLARQYTLGHNAVLRIVADEWLAHGVCDRSQNELAARAGVSRKVVKQAIRFAERDELIAVQRRPRSGRKHLTNIIRIIKHEWITWLRHGRRKTYATNACNRAKPDFPLSRGVLRSPPRSQVLRKAGDDRVDKTVKKENRTGASRA